MSIFYVFQNTNMILEEFYEGEECDVDVLLSQGRAVYAKVSDNWASPKPWFQETGGICPSLKPDDHQDQMIQLSVDVLRVLGFRAGAFHVECIWCSNEAAPRLIEVNARLGGVSVHELNRVAWGVDLAEEHIMAVCGIPIAPEIPERPLRYIAEVFLTAPYSGTLCLNDWLSFSESDVHRIDYLAKLGDVVQGPEDGTPDWLACVLAVSDDNSCNARKKLRRLIKNAPVPISSNAGDAEKPKPFSIPGGL